MKPLFYSCGCTRGLRGLCFFISILHLIYVVSVALAFVYYPSFRNGFYDFIEVFSPKASWLVLFALAMEVFLVPVWCISLFIGCLVRKRIFALVTLWLQGIGLCLGAVHHLFCQWWHQSSQDFRILLIYSLFLWIRAFCFFITHSFYHQLGRELVLVHPDYRRDSFVLPHLRPEYDRTQVLMQRGTGPSDTAEEHVDDAKKQQNKKKGASNAKQTRRPQMLSIST